MPAELVVGGGGGISYLAKETLPESQVLVYYRV